MIKTQNKTNQNCLVNEIEDVSYNNTHKPRQLLIANIKQLTTVAFIISAQNNLNLVSNHLHDTNCPEV